MTRRTHRLRRPDDLRAQRHAPSWRCTTCARGEGRPLLLLHGLGERSPAGGAGHVAAWPGPVVRPRLHRPRASTVPAGGGYTAEVLMADADAALAELGPATVLGRGLGAYVALLIAGARPDLVRGAILADGPGLVGGGIRPSSPLAGAARPRPAGGARSATRWPSCPATSARPTTPPSSCAWRCRARRSTSPSPWPPWCGPSGWPRWSPSSAWSSSPSIGRWPGTPPSTDRPGGT